MDTPLFSIIVPVYKAEQYLHQCLDSIQKQTFADFQVVLVDDGSPDGSGAICDDYARRDNRFTVIHKENGGQGSARKAAVPVCRGEYIVCVDSDDYIAPDHLERFAAVIKSAAPDAILFGATRFPGQTQQYTKTMLPAGLYTGEKLEEIRRNLICADDAQMMIQYGVCLAVVKKTLYAAYQMPVPGHIRRGEDLAVTVPLLAAGESVQVLDYCGYFYRDNPASTMNTFCLDEVQQMKDLADYLYGVLDPEYHRKVDMYVATHYFDFLDRAMLTMTYGEYRKLVRQTLDRQLYGYLARAKCQNNRMWQIVFALMRLRCFGALWILRKIRKRKV